MHRLKSLQTGKKRKISQKKSKKRYVIRLSYFGIHCNKFLSEYVELYQQYRFFHLLQGKLKRKMWKISVSFLCSCFKKLPDLAFTSFLKTLNDTLLIQITDCGKYIRLSKGLSQEIYILNNWIWIISFKRVVTVCHVPQNELLQGSRM